MVIQDYEIIMSLVGVNVLVSHIMNDYLLRNAISVHYAYGVNFSTWL